MSVGSTVTVVKFVTESEGTRGVGRGVLVKRKSSYHVNGSKEGWKDRWGNRETGGRGEGLEIYNCTRSRV